MERQKLRAKIESKESSRRCQGQLHAKRGSERGGVQARTRIGTSKYADSDVSAHTTCTQHAGASAPPGGGSGRAAAFIMPPASPHIWNEWQGMARVQAVVNTGWLRQGVGEHGSLGPRRRPLAQGWRGAQRPH